MATYFCLVYPEAVHDGAGVGVVSNIQRSGVIIEHQCARILDVEEAKAVFYARRFEPDFDDFCKQMCLSECWILHLTSENNLNELNDFITPEQMNMLFIPQDMKDHKILLKLSDKYKYAKKDLEAIVAELRQKIAQTEIGADHQFAEAAVNHGRKVYAYYTAMRVAGFEKAEAFQLAKNMHNWLLVQDSEEGPTDPAADDSAEEDDK